MNLAISRSNLEPYWPTALLETETTHDMDCSICLDIIPSKTSIKQLTCNHIFHSRCLMNWLSSQNTCPYCRDIISIEETFSDHPLNETVYFVFFLLFILFTFYSIRFFLLLLHCMFIFSSIYFFVIYSSLFFLLRRGS